MYQNLN